MTSRISRTLGVLAAAAATTMPASAQQQLRPPAVPLVTADPYLSIWSESDNLTGSVTRHWTHRPQALASLIRIDGKPYRLMGLFPADVPALPQTGLEVTPTRSIYHFANTEVNVTMTFMTPALPNDLEVLARPLSYITWQVNSADGKRHDVSIFDSASSQISVNEPDHQVVWQRDTFGPVTALRAGTKAQTYLRPAGDDARIDWGYVYIAAKSNVSKSAMGSADSLMDTFVRKGGLPKKDDTRQPRAANDDQPALAFTFNLGKIGTAPVSRHVSVAYDEIYAIKFFNDRLQPYWRRNGATPSDLLQAAERDYDGLTRRCEAFDQEMTADLTRVGGERYAQMAALSYRQTLAGSGLAADRNKQPLIFTKENTSNGCIATVDVFYPAAPQYLLMGPTYAKALVAPAMLYGAASDRWRFPFAPHDLGVYPQATAQVYGGGESPGNEADKMPVEESGNMILLCAAIAKEEGNADFASRFWPQLTKWEQYLEQYGLDPEDQLCTDDFMGHLAHNSNLAVKAILAIAAYGELCRMRGDQAAADKYMALAREDARHWVEASKDGDHSRLAFDQPNTWSQKYNLVWDKILDLNVFPADTARKEVAYYKTVMQKYGVPLDSRTHGTKVDWSVWSATMATDKADFQAIVDPMWDYFNGTTTRDAMADQFNTDDIHSGGMHARPVIGGVFMPLLADKATWKKWASADTGKAAGWAAIAPPPVVTPIVPTSQQTAQTWKYTTTEPSSDWMKTTFNDSAWQSGPGGFGTAGTPGAVVGTTWNTGDIWLRRTVTVPDTISGDLMLYAYHDEDLDVYFNGVPASSEGGYTSSYVPLDITPEAKALIKPGATITIAVHCHQTTGGQGVDVGIATVK